MKFLPKNQRGFLLLYIIIIIAIFSILMLPLLGIASQKLTMLKTATAREESLQIAEAGINYYQWHLAHFPSDYNDRVGGAGAIVAGPYVHSYTDFDTQQVIGQFSLVITPPTTGSTIVTIQSTGWTTGNPTITRTVIAKYGIPSIAKYAFLSNSIIWIGNNETVSGQLQSNNGVRFDGVGNAPIQSALSTYTCPSGQGSPCPTTENGVWGGASQAVKNFWQFPVPAVDFSSLTSNLANMASQAQSGGIFLPPSNAQGYSLVFNSNGTLNVYIINSLSSNPTGWDTNNVAHNEYTSYNSNCICASNCGNTSCGRTLVSGYPKSIPSNGIIYVEDKTWVEGTVNGRATVAAAELPYNASTAPTIYIPNNILYATKDGTSELGLIAQNNIVVSYNAPSNLEIDAALISQNGGEEFFYYKNDVAIKNTITIYGSIMTFSQWTWTWVDTNNNVVSGYQNTVDNYDSNLLYGPPPSFPFSSSNYQQLSWISN